MVWRLDRLGRSVRDLINTVTDLNSAGIAFRSLAEGIDTTTSTGRFMLTILAGLAEMERELVRERTIAGLEAARAGGRHGGRPRALTPVAVKRARALRGKGLSYREIGEVLGVHATTVHRYMNGGHQDADLTSAQGEDA